MFPTIDDLKAQCRIDSDDDSEDALLSLYGEAARSKVQKYLNRPLYDDEVPPEVANGKLVDASVKLAILLAVGHWYANREAASRDSLTEVPLGFYSLLSDDRYLPGT
ncbi:TPA: head-tail connector protein [Klebsiella michiganensis]